MVKLGKLDDSSMTLVTMEFDRCKQNKRVMRESFRRNKKRGTGRELL